MKKIVIALLGMLALSCADMFGPLDNPFDPNNLTNNLFEPWGRSTITSNTDTSYSDMVQLNNGSMFVVGHQDTGTVTYENGFACNVIDTTSATVSNYSESGELLWAKRLLVSGDELFINSAAYDGSHVYLAGYFTGTVGVSVVFDGPVSLTAQSANNNPVLLKMTEEGTIMWARGLTDLSNSTSGSAKFNAVAVDDYGDIVVVGQQFSSYNYNYGNGNLSMPSSSSDIPVVLEYGVGGNIISETRFVQNGENFLLRDVFVASNGDKYMVGTIGVTGYDLNLYGGGTINTSAAGSGNAAIVVCIRNVGGFEFFFPTASSWSFFESVVEDSNGDIWVNGGQGGTSTFNYGSTNLTGSSTGNNPVMLKFNSGILNSPMAMTASSISGQAFFTSMTPGAGGEVMSTLLFDDAVAFGSGVDLPDPDPTSDLSSAVLTFNSSLQASKTYTGSPLIGVTFRQVYYDNAGGLYISGSQSSGGTYEYPGGVALSGAAVGSDNCILLKLNK